MQFFIKTMIIFFAGISLAACGGGGGGSNDGSTSSGGTPAPVETDTLRLSAGAINFSVTQFEALPEDTRVTATITGSNTAGIIFGTLPGVEGLPFWLNVELGDLVDNSVDAVFEITRSDLPPGTYDFTVRAVTFDENDRELDTADLIINYTVAEGIPLSVAPESVDVTLHLASEPVTEVISVTAGNYEWSAFSSDANFDFATATGSQDLTLSIFPPMEELVDENGQYQGTVDILQNGTSNNSLFLINFTVVPTLENIGGEGFLNAIAGEADGGTIGVNLKGQGLNWAASADVPWLSFSAPSGIIETDDLSVDGTEGDDFFVSVDGATLTEGRHTALITVTADAEQTLEIPVTVEVAPQIISVSQRGFALTDTPAVSRLEAIVDIDTNASRIASWTATSNASWLSVTPSGSINDDLMITADPAALVNETTTQAIVTLSSPDSEISNAIEIHIGLWKSAVNPVDGPIVVGGLFPENLIVADPIRPLAYVHSGETEINIVHTYTGAIEKTFSLTERVFNFDVSDDGAFLYLVRSGEDEGFVDVVDLDTQEITTTFTYPVGRLNARDSQDIGFGRILNEAYLFTSPGVALNASTGEVGTIFNRFPESLMVRDDLFCGSVDNSSFSEFGCLEFVTAGFDGARITSVVRATGETTGGRLRLSQNADRLFAVDRGVISVYETSDLTLIRTIETSLDDFVEAAELDSRGNLYVTFMNQGFVPVDPSETMIDESRFLKIFDRDLDLLEEVTFPTDGGIVPSLQAASLSGDERRMITLVDSFNGAGLDVNFVTLD